MSILQRYFFEVFLSDFDIVLRGFFNTLNASSKVFYLSTFNDLFSYDKNFIRLFFPIKLTRVLLNFFSLKYFSEFKKHVFLKYFSVLFPSNYVKLFSRKIFYERYLDHFIIGIIGNNKFANYVKSNFVSFLRSSFKSDIREIEIFHCGSEWPVNNSLFIWKLRERLFLFSLYEQF